MIVYPNDTFQNLEFEQVKEKILPFCRTRFATSRILQLKPVSDFHFLSFVLKQTEELKNTFTEGSYFPDSEFPEITEEIKLLRIDGSSLTELQLLAVKQLAQTANQLIRFIQRNAESFPTLKEIFIQLQANDEVVSAIEKVLDTDGSVKSSASRELGNIRSALASKKRESDKKFNTYVTQLNQLGYLRDTEESYYNERRVLAVISDFKKEVKGIVQGSSDTGKTTFVEPIITLELNNEIAELKDDERREVFRILKELCNAVRPFASQLETYLKSLCLLDFIRAKALFAQTTDSHLPVLTPDANLNLINAYHPVLWLQNKELKKKTVPLNLKLDKTEKILIVSGPNAGGKSIAMKTAGLLQLMVQSGLLVPCSPQSVMGIYTLLLTDIGDHQSIKDELSTYSSRLEKMKKFLNSAHKRTLLLIDEFGSGTDPELGGAVAEAILEELIRSKAQGVITTHYSNIKLKAEKTPGLINGCMLFDLNKLEPTYILSTGQPGSSFTLEVAQRIGLPESIIKSAAQKVERNKLRLNTILVDLQNQKNELHKKNDELEKKLNKLQQSEKRYNHLTQKLEDKLENDKEKTDRINREAQAGRRLLKIAQEYDNSKEKKTEAVKNFLSLAKAERERISEENKPENKESKRQQKLEKVKSWIKEGSLVKIANSQIPGVVQKIKKDRALVLFEDKRTEVALEELVEYKDLVAKPRPK